jgi:hypothetical protein
LLKQDLTQMLMRCGLGNVTAQYQQYVYEISSNAPPPRECEDVPAPAVKGGVVFVATELDLGVDEVEARSMPRHNMSDMF